MITLPIYTSTKNPGTANRPNAASNSGHIDLLMNGSNDPSQYRFGKLRWRRIAHPNIGIAALEFGFSKPVSIETINVARPSA